MADLFSDLTTVVLRKSLDLVGYKQRVIANNIANVETPGFKRSDVSFEEQLRAALSSTGSADIAEERIGEIQPTVQEDTLSPMRADGNNVSIDKEMAELTKNALQYETLIRMYNMKNAMLLTAITEGKR